MSTYAMRTSVSTEASRNEIERTLKRYGASAFAYGWNGSDAMVQFEAHDRRIRFVLHLPDRGADEFRLTPARGTRRSSAAADAAWEQACRQRWRALALCIKAKLAAVETGISTFEEEFLAHLVLPNGSTVGEWVGPQIASAYTSGQMPALLPGA